MVMASISKATNGSGSKWSSKRWLEYQTMVGVATDGWSSKRSISIYGGAE